MKLSTAFQNIGNSDQNSEGGICSAVFNIR